VEYPSVGSSLGSASTSAEYRAAIRSFAEWADEDAEDGLDSFASPPTRTESDRIDNLRSCATELGSSEV